MRTDNAQISEAVVIAGGGARFFYELGVLDRLIRYSGIDPFAWLGVSAGALIAAFMAQSPTSSNRHSLMHTLSALKLIARDIKRPDDIFGRRVPEMPALIDELLALAISPSVYNLDPLAHLINSHINPERLRASGRELRVGAVSLESGRYRAVSQNNENIEQFVLASCAIPIIFPPVMIDGEHYVDGGVANVSPLADLFNICRKRDVEHVRVHVILSTAFESEPMHKTRWKSVDIATRTADLLTGEILRNDIEVARLRNREPDSIHAEFWLYQPGPDGPGIGPLYFTPRETREAFWRGWRTKGVKIE